MAIQILYAQSYMQTNGKMTVDILLKNPETASIVIGMDMQTTDIPPKINGPRMVACIPANTPCYSIRYVDIPFTDPYRIYVKRCISGPNCATSGCTTFGTIVDSTVMGDMVDFGSPGVSGVPSGIFGSPHPVPSNIQTTCAAPPPPPPPIVLNVTGVTAELSTSDLFPGNQGWVRINATLTGSGMLSILVDGAQLLTDGPLNPGATPFTYTYLKQLISGTRYICVEASNRICTTIIVPPRVISTPGKSVIFSVIGNGQMYIEVNKVPTVTVFPGESKSVLLKTGNQLGIILIPYIGSTLVNLCDVPQTDCQTALSYYLDVLDENAQPQKMVATFTKAPCYPPGGVQRKCEADNKTISVWNQVDCKYDSAVCSTGYCKDGYCVSPPVTGFTVGADKTSMQSGDYVVFSGHYKTGGQKIGIYSNKAYITTTVTNAAGDYKVGSYVTIAETTTQKLTVYACAEGAISGICPLLADKSNNITIDVTPMKYDCSGAPDYACVKKPTGKYTDPDTCRAECKAPLPPVAEATHAFVINLSPLSWANLDGLKGYLPGITSEFSKAILLYGWLGWDVIESRIEDSNKLVIYLHETATVSGMGMSPIASKVRALALPTLVAITAALTTITAIAFRFGFMILGFYIVNLLTKAVEVAKTQADTEKIRTDVVAEMCKSGQLTPEQCSEALKPPAEKGICESFGFSATACDQLKTGGLVVGGLIVAYVAYKAVKTIAPSPTK